MGIIRKRIVIVIILSLCLISIGFIMRNMVKQYSETVQVSEIKLSPQDRILILAPHPDDEVLGCAGIIQKAKRMNIPLKVVFLTYGDSNQWSFLIYRKHPIFIPKAVKNMGMVRHDEALAADRLLGLLPEQLIFLGYPDFHVLTIWYAHWADQPPVKNMFTGVKTVPYSNALRPGAAYKGEEILKDLKTVIRDFKPTKIFLSHPADHHPDHRALYLFTRVALWDLENEIKSELYPYIIHYKNWPLPRGYFPDEQISPPNIFRKEISWQIYNLKTEDVDIKYKAIQQHKSQYSSNAEYLLSFIRSNELFGDFPVIKFKANASEDTLSFGDQNDLQEIPEQLIDEERAAFIGIEERSISLEDSTLVIYVRLSRPLGKTVGLSLYVFGYNKNRPFGEMPKMHIKFGALEHRIYDQSMRLSISNIKVERKAKEMIIRVPLELLGNPQYILTSANTYIGTIPLDWVSWRVIEIVD